MKVDLPLLSLFTVGDSLNSVNTLTITSRKWIIFQLDVPFTNGEYTSNNEAFSNLWIDDVTVTASMK